MIHDDFIKDFFANHDNCCGCEACVVSCPTGALTMMPDKKGFLYPIWEENKCIKCGKCIHVCDFKKKSKHENMPVSAYYFKTTDMEEQQLSTSGGAFIAVSNYILEKNGVVFGVVDDKGSVYHTYARSPKDRDRMCGSKYVQSALKGIYNLVKMFLMENKYVLFSGTPCQIAGLKNFLGEIDQDRLLTCDFVCHGVPSPMTYKMYIDYVEKKYHKRIHSHTFRKKINGWGHVECNCFEDGSADYLSVDSQLQKKVFYSNVALREACFSCKYCSVSRPSDITLADAWGIDSTDAAFHDKNGVSLLLINTSKAERILRELPSQYIYKSVPIGDVSLHQPQLKSPTNKSCNYDKFWGALEKHGYRFAAYKYAFSHKEKIKNILIWLRIFGVVKKIRSGKKNGNE